MLKNVAKSTFRNVTSIQKRLSSQSGASVDASEINFFEKNFRELWDENGPMKPLHTMNKLRIPLIRDGILQTVPVGNVDQIQPLKGFKVLDVGCGGGILSECLARIGANVTGLDASSELIQIAKNHANLDSALKSDNLTYECNTIEDYSLSNFEKYDALVISEVLEHVSSKEAFLETCVKCLKPQGSIFLTTLNKNWLGWFAGIFLAESVLKLVPAGTHNYEKFLQPHELQRMLEKINCRTVLMHGMFYNPLQNSWTWTSPNRAVNYGLHAVKM